MVGGRHPIRARTIVLGYAILSLLLAAWFVTAVLGSNAHPVEHSDYMSYHAAGDVILAGGGAHLYEPPVQRAAQEALMPPDVPFTRGLPFNNPPTLALLAVPFAALSLGIGFAVWNLVGAGALVTVGAMVTRSSGILPWLLAASAWPTVTAILRGQVSLLVTACLLAAVALAPSRQGWSGTLMGLATIKPTLVPLIGLWMVARRAWRAVGIALVVAIALLLIAAMAVGLPAVLEYPTYAASQLSDSNAAGIHPDQMINWRAVSLWLGFPLEVMLALTALTLGVVAAIWWRTGADATIAPAAALVATPLVIPHANQHEALLAVAAWLLLFNRLGATQRWLGPLGVAGHLTMWLALPLWGEAAAMLTVTLLLVSLVAVTWLAWHHPQAGMSTNGAGHGPVTGGNAAGPGW